MSRETPKNLAIIDKNLKTLDLKKTAIEIRKSIIEMISAAQSGHPGGSLSAADILTALYFHEMNIDPQNPSWPDRDRFVLSKGHAAPALYATLAQRGFFPKEELQTLRKLGSPLQGHPDMNKVPGVDMSTGSLGQGLSAGIGMAFAAKLDGKGYRTHVLLGDGELNEGMTWEAAMAAAHYNLDNLVAIVDNNGLQIDGTNAEVMNTAPLNQKFASFGWHVEEVNGHDIAALIRTFEMIKEIKGKPSVIIAKTIKGKGVSFMENQAGWHGKSPSPEQTAEALAELKLELENIEEKLDRELARKALKAAGVSQQ